MMDLSIRRVSIAEQAEAAARTAAETGEAYPNPHPAGSDDWHAFRAAYERFLLLFSAADAEGSA